MIMNSFSSEKSQSKSQGNSEVLVNVIVKQETDGRTIAIVPGLPELYVEASDRTTALDQLQERLENHLAGAEIVSLAVKLPSQKQKNPWLEMAGIFKNDPQFDQMLEAIETYRRELDENIEDDFQQK
jgi:predicted RNase H-like HicB family nuclease